MPLMIMDRKFRLATTEGHVILFEKDVETGVANSIVGLALQHGARLVDPSEMPKPKVVDDEPVEVPTDKDRKSKIHSAIEQMVTKNQRGDFTAAGKPNLRRLREIAGFEVDPLERDVIFEEIMQAGKE